MSKDDDEKRRKEGWKAPKVEFSLSKLDISPMYSGYDESFYPTGYITGYQAIKQCSCGHMVEARGSSQDICLAILEGRMFAHFYSSDQHPEY